MASKGLELKTHIYDYIIHTPTLIWADLQCTLVGDHKFQSLVICSDPLCLKKWMLSGMGTGSVMSQENRMLLVHNIGMCNRVGRYLNLNKNQAGKRSPI